MDKYISKPVEVEALQYPSGDYQVTFPSGDVANMGKEAFEAKFEPVKVEAPKKEQVLTPKQ